MRRFELHSTTFASRILLALAIAACGDKLDGATTCDNLLSCGSDQLCRDQFMGAADDGGVTEGCISVPSSCDASDCSGSGCPMCIHQLCEPPYDTDVSVTGRRLRCDP
jgi:hypothetical protein